MKLSVIVPAYNEEAVLPEFYSALKATLDTLPLNAEILFINDGSRDNTLGVLQSLRTNDPRIVILDFSRNFGHQMAITAGLDHATGEVCITMDSDLQHPPSVIPELLRSWQAGHKVVHAIREQRPGESVMKQQSSGLFYRVLRRLTDVEIQPEAGDFRLLDRTVVDIIKSMRERHRFIRGLSAWVGFSQNTVPYLQASRQAGESKYTWTRMIRFAWDGITSFSSIPLHLASYLGFTLSALSGAYLVYAVIAKWTGHVVSGWTSIISVILFLGGAQLLMLGIFGEYLGRLYEQTRDRPLYILQAAYGLTSNPPSNHKG